MSSQPLTQQGHRPLLLPTFRWSPWRPRQQQKKQTHWIVIIDTNGMMPDFQEAMTAAVTGCTQSSPSDHVWQEAQLFRHQHPDLWQFFQATLERSEGKPDYPFQKEPTPLWVTPDGERRYRLDQIPQSLRAQGHVFYPVYQSLRLAFYTAPRDEMLEVIEREAYAFIGRQGHHFTMIESIRVIKEELTETCIQVSRPVEMQHSLKEISEQLQKQVVIR